MRDSLKSKYLAGPKRLSNFLWKDCEAPVAYGVAVCIALLYFFYLYPATFLTGKGAFFSEGDASQHVAGWLFYARDRWHFPLLYTDRLNFPEGASIAFTDSIPLAALVLKTIASWLPPGFQYIGVWNLVAYLTQAVAATFLIRSLGVRHLLGLAVSVVLAVTWPSLSARLGHTSLMTHSLILFALAVYFLGRRGAWTSNTTFSAFVILSLVALLIHPYFLAFSQTVFLAYLADQAISGESWKRQFLRLCISTSIIFAAGIVLGYFGNTTIAWGYGFYSMNLTAPFCGGRIFPCFTDATGGQCEGYNYFGAGVMLLLAFTVFTRWSLVKSLPRRYPALLVAAVFLTIYALSNNIYFGSYRLVHFDLPAAIDIVTGTFRASGRFFWVTGYLILFGLLGTVLKNHSFRTVVLLTIVLSLQWVDTGQLRNIIILSTSRPDNHNFESWRELMTGIDKINLFPAYGCGECRPEDYWYFELL